VVNRERGEVAIVLGGTEYCLRPTFQALAEIEARAGVGLVPLARRFLEREFGLKEVLAVLGPAIEAGGAKPPADLGDCVVRAGIANYFGPVSEFLTLALGGETSWPSTSES
jgi:hypothetical protein